MPKRERLTDRQVIRLHHLMQDGHGRRAVARILGCSPNTVYAHCSHQVAYSSDVISKCNLRRPLSRGSWLSLDEAAPWLPGHPSHGKMFAMASSGLLKAKLVEDAGARNGRIKYVTKFAWMRRYALSVLPAGIWVPVAEAHHYAGRPIVLAPALRLRKHGDEGVVSLRSFVAACEAGGCAPSIGPAIMRRAVLAVDRVGCCLL